MAKIQFLTILLTVTCFLGGVISITDKEFEALVDFVHQQATSLDEQSKVVNEQSMRIEKLSITVEQQSDFIQHLENENKVMMKEIKWQETLMQKLNSLMIHDVANDLIQNTTIEERVSLLEIKVVVIQDDLTGIEDDVTDLEVNLVELEGDVNFLFDEQVIQDERLLNLEQTTIGITGELDLVEDELEDLQVTTTTLDFRVTALEENGGSDANSSVAELEVRVETLEGTAVDHETRISTVEADVNDLEETVADQETRLTSSEENIQGLQMTDVELDARVTALEETGSTDPSNATVAFHTVLTVPEPDVSEGRAVLFDEVLINEGDGYNSITGAFTVPIDGDGYYFFSTNLIVDNGEFGYFDIEINGGLLCTAYNELEQTSSDLGPATCSAVAYVTQGDTVQVVYIDGTNTTPVFGSSTYHYTGFTGFKI